MTEKKMLVGKATDAISTTEMKDFLYRYAKKNDIEITEFKSKDGLYFAHLDEVDKRSATAVGKDQISALLMAFLNFENPKYTFVD